MELVLLGDAKYTEMGRRRKEHNIGQLVRDRFGQDNVFNVGFRSVRYPTASLDASLAFHLLLQLKRALSPHSILIDLLSV